MDIPSFDDEHRRVLAETVEGVRIIDTYVSNGLRIDLVMTSAALAAKCDACHIDKTPRA